MRKTRNTMNKIIGKIEKVKHNKHNWGFYRLLFRTQGGRLRPVPTQGGSGVPPSWGDLKKGPKNSPQKFGVRPTGAGGYPPQGGGVRPVTPVRPAGGWGVGVRPDPPTHLPGGFTNLEKKQGEESEEHLLREIHHDMKSRNRGENGFVEISQKICGQMKMNMCCWGNQKKTPHK